jgi:hypothetical protein
MAADNFEENSWTWQGQQWGQQLQEWWELHTRLLEKNLPSFSLPDWLKNLGLPPWLYQLIFWLLLGLVLVWLGWQLVSVGIPYFQKVWQHSPLFPSSPQVKTKPLSVAKWLKRSQQFQAQGNYSEACRCLYFALLQQLDDGGIIPQRISRTDREYQQLVAAFPKNSLYHILLTTHEELCFGLQPISPEKFTQCQQALETILKSSPDE